MHADYSIHVRSYILKIKEYIAVSWLHGYAERNADTQVNAVVVSIMRRCAHRLLVSSARNSRIGPPKILVCMSANIFFLYIRTNGALCFFSTQKVMY